MRTIFAKCCLCFSILICAFGLLLMGGWVPAGSANQELSIAVPFLIGYAVMLIVTFPVYRVRSQWKAIFEVSTTQSKAAHFALWLSILNFAIFVLVALFARVISGPISDSLVLRFVGSFLWLNGVYLVIHWAYRPENVFARSTLILLNNPILAMVSAKYRRNATKAR